MRSISILLTALVLVLAPMVCQAHPAVDEADATLDAIEAKIKNMTLDDIKSKRATAWSKSLVQSIKDLKAKAAKDKTVKAGGGYVAFMKRAVAVSKTLKPTMQRVIAAAKAGKTVPRTSAGAAKATGGTPGKLTRQDAGLIGSAQKNYNLLVKRLGTVKTAELRDETVAEDLRSRFDKIAASLAKVSLQDHPSLVKTQGALKKLRAKFEGVMAKVGKTAAPRAGKGFTAADRAHAVAFQKLYGEVFKRLKTTQVKDLKDEKTRDLFEKQLGELEGHVKGMSDGAHPTAQAMAKNLAGLKGFYDKAAGKAEKLGEAKTVKELPFADMRHIKTFQKEYNRVRATFDDIDLVKIQNPKSVEFLQGILDRLWTPITRISAANAGHPYVKTAKEWHQGLKDKMNEAIRKGKELAAGAGDVDEQLRLVQEQFPFGKFSAKLEKPYTAESIEEWAGTIRNWGKGAAGAVAFFEDAAKKSVKARSPEFLAYAKWFRGQVPLILDREKGKVVGFLEGEIRIATSRQKRLEMDRLVNEGYATATIREIERGIVGVEGLLAFERGYDGAEKAETKARLEALNKLMDDVTQHAQETQRQATIDRRMPRAASEDGELIEIVKKIIAEPKLKIGPVERVVINAPVKEIKAIDWWDGSWLKRHGKEFQATVAEKVGDRYFLRPVTCRFYWHTGRYAAPTNRWFCGGTWKGKEILKENIHK